jgi:hypothetical protein
LAAAKVAPTTLIDGRESPIFLGDWASTKGVGGLYQSRDQSGSAARRQAETNRRLLEKGNASLTPEQDEKRLAYLHAQSCIEN